MSDPVQPTDPKNPLDSSPQDAEETVAAPESAPTISASADTHGEPSQSPPHPESTAPESLSTQPPAPNSISAYAPEEHDARWRGNFDFLKSLFLGGVLTAVFYEIFPLPFIDQGRLLSFFDNSISPVILTLTFWSIFLLFFKFLRYRQEDRVWRMFRHGKVRRVLERKIYAREVVQVLEELRGALTELKVKKYAQSTVYLRVMRVLHFVRSASKKEGLDGLLDYQASIDMKKLETGYTLLQVFIWAIPILGFIGTVLGIGFSVNEFAQFIQTAEGGGQFSTQMRMALGGVTSGLAVAFNTTFLALVLVIPVMVLTSLLQKSEEELLVEIEEFCLESLLPNLHVSPGDEALSEGFDEHLHRILRLSETWLGQFQPLVEQMVRKTEMLQHQMEGVQPLVKDFTDRLLHVGEEPPSTQQDPAADASETPPPPPKADPV